MGTEKGLIVCGCEYRKGLGKFLGRADTLTRTENLFVRELRQFKGKRAYGNRAFLKGSSDAMYPEHKICQRWDNHADQLHSLDNLSRKQNAKKVEGGSRGLIPLTSELGLNSADSGESCGRYYGPLWVFEVIPWVTLWRMLKGCCSKSLDELGGKSFENSQDILGSEICKNTEESRIQGGGLTESWFKKDGSKAGVRRKGTSVLVCWRALGFHVGYPGRDANQKPDVCIRNSEEVSGRRERLRCHQQAACKRKEGIRLLESWLLICPLGRACCTGGAEGPAYTGGLLEDQMKELEKECKEKHDMIIREFGPNP